jgi:hypothetical protein
MPIHPELFDQLYLSWGSRPEWQHEIKWDGSRMSTSVPSRLGSPTGARPCGRPPKVWLKAGKTATC